MISSAVLTGSCRWTAPRIRHHQKEGPHGPSDQVQPDSAPNERGDPVAPDVTDTSGKGERYVIEQSDATQAYCQAELGGSTTWIRLPEHRRPESWASMRDPVCKLVKALYGHPNSGCYWEQRCESKVLREGFRRIGNCGEWRSCYVHDELGVVLVVYVDDFKMSGPESSMKPAWALLRNGEGALDMDDPQTLDSYLGCKHEIDRNAKAPDGTPVTKIEYNVQPFLESCLTA